VQEGNEGKGTGKPAPCGGTKMPVLLGAGIRSDLNRSAPLPAPRAVGQIHSAAELCPAQRKSRTTTPPEAPQPPPHAGRHAQHTPRRFAPCPAALSPALPAQASSLRSRMFETDTRACACVCMRVHDQYCVDRECPPKYSIRSTNDRIRAKGRTCPETTAPERGSGF
jgi:hypothetical protein